MSADPVAASASRCEVWIFDGPAPKRPSAGSRSAGIWRASVTVQPFERVECRWLTTLSGVSLFCQHHCDR